MADGNGTFVDIGGRALYARVRGAGPAVILNSGGGAPGIGTWAALEPLIESFATVVTYDRAGTGRSPPPPGFPTVADMASDLHALLGALGIRNPITLVGWSLSALMVQLYACQRPKDVAGMLLLDPTPDEAFAGFFDHPAELQESLRAASIAASRRLGAGDSAVLEFNRFPESCELVRQAVTVENRMPNIPLIVLTASIPSQSVQRMGHFGMQEAHRRIAQRVPRGQQIDVEKSSHSSLVSDHPRLVAEFIRELVRTG